MVLVNPAMLDGYWFWGGYGSLEAPPPTHSSDEVHSTAEISPFDAILRYATTNSAKEVLVLVADPELITKKVYPLIFGEIFVTYLAFIFIPKGFFSSLLIMSNALSSRDATVYGVFFAVAIPVTLLALLVAANWNRVLVWFSGLENIMGPVVNGPSIVGN